VYERRTNKLLMTIIRCYNKLIHAQTNHTRRVVRMRPVALAVFKAKFFNHGICSIADTFKLKRLPVTPMKITNVEPASFYAPSVQITIRPNKTEYSYWSGTAHYYVVTLEDGTRAHLYAYPPFRPAIGAEFAEKRIGPIPVYVELGGAKIYSWYVIGAAGIAAAELLYRLFFRINLPSRS
jgi:hypothetical protein